MKSVAIIPARGGSKAIPMKNIKLLCGKPLLYYPIKAALNYADKVIVSTDNEQIEKIALECGAEVIKRPVELAKDDTPTMPVLIHAVKELESKGFKPDVILLLYATAPLTNNAHVKQALKIMKSHDSLISVCKDSSKIWSYENNKPVPLLVKRDNRQKVSQYRENGAIYAMSYEVLMNNSYIGKSLELLIMSDEESVDINTIKDFFVAEAIMKKVL